MLSHVMARASFDGTAAAQLCTLERGQGFTGQTGVLPCRCSGLQCCCTCA